MTAPPRFASRSPTEGWVTLALVILLCLSMAWSFDDAQLVIGQPSYTDFLMWAAIAGVLAGFIGPKVGWGRWTTYVIGACLAALVTPLLVGAMLLPSGDLGDQFQATAASSVNAFIDLVVEDRLTTPEYGHHMLVLGLLVWGSSMFASYAAFGHRRPLNAIILIGALLIGNMAFTTNDQLAYLVLYSLTGLFLLIRFHTFEEQSEWLRRRIGDPAAISGLYLRGGTVFIGVAVATSLLLTTVASSDPLAVVWRDVGSRVIEWTRGLERFLPAPGMGIALGPSFGSSASIQGVWRTSPGLALTVEVDDPEAPLPYWTAAVYDEIQLDGFRQGPRTDLERPAGTEILADTGDAVTAGGRRPLTVTITPDVATSTVFAPSVASKIDVPVTLEVIGLTGYQATIRRDVSDAPYTVTALIPTLGDGPQGGLTENRLRAAPENYPIEIEQLYTDVPEGIIGPDAEALLENIVATSPSDDPYDLADTIKDYLRSPIFQYDDNVRDQPCESISVVECFARFKEGYCEYYASTMVALLRELDIPARFVEGYLPGALLEGTRTVEVKFSDAHAWVEVYFPGYGWVAFDPTGGERAQDAPIPSGRPVPTVTPGPTSSFDPFPSGGVPGADIGDGRGGPGDTGFAGGSTAPLIAVALLLAGILGCVAFIAWQRGPRGPVTADSAYRGVTRLASRLGFAPRPDQTVYEFASALGDVVPVARPELETVAQAKVEVAYGGRVLGDDRLTSLRDAQRRLRLSLLRLLFRRRGRQR